MHRLRRAAQRIAQPILGQLLATHLAHLGLHVLERADRAQIGLEHHVQLEALVLDAKDQLLVLVLLGAYEGRVLGPARKGHINAVEYLQADIWSNYQVRCLYHFF